MTASSSVCARIIAYAALSLRASRVCFIQTTCAVTIDSHLTVFTNDMAAQGMAW